MGKFSLLLTVLFLCKPLLAAIQFHRLESLPAALSAQVGQPTWSMRGQEKLDFSNLMLKQVSSKTFRVELPHAQYVLEAGQPRIPTVVRQLSVPQNHRAEILLSDVVAEESDGPIPLKKVPEPFIWGDATFPSGQWNGYFPGKLFQAKQGQQTLYLNFFPTQVDAKTGRVIFIRSFKVWVNYVPEPYSTTVHDVLLEPSLIVTSVVLKDSALKLRDLHERMGMKSRVVFVEEINQTTSPVEETTLPQGYKNESAIEKEKVVVPWDEAKNTGYNYSLARKVIQFIRHWASSAVRFRYVTLLGDSTLVPPSYYFSLPSTFYRKWGVTDQCYSSREDCLQPQWALGRLPFHTNEEVTLYLQKVNRYLDNKEVPSSELALLGGKAFPKSEVYVGELGALELIDSISANWKGVKKYFRTKGNYTTDTLLQLVRGELDSKFVYAVDHGVGNQLYVEREFVSSKQVLETKAVSHPSTPIVVSISCSNAAFDETLTKEAVFAAKKHGDVSVGTALLKAEAGAVAYWGSARVALGSPVYEFDSKGNLNFQGTDYGLQIQAKFFDQYVGRGSGRLGDLILGAQENYVLHSGNDMTSPANSWSYYIATLLGDPVLLLPVRKDGETSVQKASAKDILQQDGFGIPQVEMKVPSVFSFNVESIKPVQGTLYHWIQNEFATFQGEEIVQEIPKVEGMGEVKFPLTSDSAIGVYFLRLENLEGVPRERQVWFNINSTVSESTLPF